MSRYNIREVKYVSTRDAEGSAKISSAEAIKRGIAPDGGLYMPASMPRFGIMDLSQISKATYPARAAYILGRYLTDFTAGELLSEAEKAYSGFDGYPAPLRGVSGRESILELWHGPTCAFKDMALQIMPRLLSLSLGKTGEKNDAMILTATSGDTGKAALEGFRDVPRTRIMVFYPAHGVSAVQRLQMVTQEGSNVRVCGVNGNFDDAQTGVKRIFGDREMISALAGKGLFLSSANSINWGRLAPQIVYYFSAYCDMASEGKIKLGDEIDVCVPTGNFGDIFAAYIAKASGLPIARLICASNRNSVLTDFFSTGTYDRRREFYTTSSPSMDILISSNLERLLWAVCGPEETAAHMKALSADGCYTVSAETKAALSEVFSGYYAGEEECAAQIKRMWDEEGYLADPHTAVALACAEKYRRDCPGGRRLLTVSTASPYKFAGSVLEAISGSRPDDETKAADMLSSLTGVPVPAPLRGLDRKTVRFSAAVDPEDMAGEVLGFGEM
ncbi:MAG: threonine synthase [Clostridiales bacterium]|nr:threonine synthase [Clostridiales bacterium]